MRIWVLLGLLISGCPETGLNSDTGIGNAWDSDEPGGGANSLGEYCNGKDDNGNGEVDEGWPDSDGDGLPDCLEKDCDVVIPEPEDIPIDPLCKREPWYPPEAPWDVAVEWHAETGGTGVVTTPVVGNLTDDNGDGFVDDRDDPEIAFTTHTTNELVVLDGKTGTERWRVPGVQGSAGVIIADVDADGNNEVVAMSLHNVSFYITAYSATGSVKWSTKAPWDMTIYSMATVADLDADGRPEVIFDKLVLDGVTGELLADLPVWQPFDPPALRTPVVGDIDLDGQKEILLGPDIFTMDGTRIRRNLRAQTRTVHNAIANVDSDGEAEIITIYQNYMEVIDTDGRLLHVSPLPATNGGPPCVADFDGDGIVELGIGVGKAVAVYELDGKLLWEHYSVDATLAHAGCSGYDFDGDGAYELLHADQHAFYIFDGASGAVMYRDDRHTSTTHFEYPVVADVDNDGAAEIILGSNTHENRPGWAGITVFGHSGSGWARSGSTWGVHDFAVTNLDGDGGVPVDPVPPWLAFNVFRARPTIDSPAMANLQVRITDVCVGTCEGGPAKVSYVVQNEGGATVRAGTRLTLFRLDRFDEIPLESRLLGAIKPGHQLGGDMFVLEPEDLGDGLVIRVDEDADGRGWVEECNEDDNFAVWENGLCR